MKIASASAPIKMIETAHPTHAVTLVRFFISSPNGDVYEFLFFLVPHDWSGSKRGSVFLPEPVRIVRPDASGAYLIVKRFAGTFRFVFRQMKTSESLLPHKLDMTTATLQRIQRGWR